MLRRLAPPQAIAPETPLIILRKYGPEGFRGGRVDDKNSRKGQDRKGALTLLLYMAQVCDVATPLLLLLKWSYFTSLSSTMLF